MHKLPARRAALVWRAVGDEVLVHDPDTGAVHLIGRAMAELTEADLLAVPPSRRDVLLRGAVLGAGALAGTVGLPIASAHASTPAKTVVRLVAAGTGSYPPYTDYTPPAGATQATKVTDAIATTALGVTEIPPQGVLQNEQYGNSFTVSVTGLTPSSNYTIRVFFAETYFINSAGRGGIGKRIFDVDVNGVNQTRLYDIYKAATVAYSSADGSDRAVFLDYSVASGSTGSATLKFYLGTGGVDNAKWDALIAF